MYFFSPKLYIIEDDMQKEWNRFLDEDNVIILNDDILNPGFTESAVDFILDNIKPKFKSANLIELRMSIKEKHIYSYEIYDANNASYGCCCKIEDRRIHFYLTNPYADFSFSNEDLNELKALTMELKLSK